MNNYQSIPFKDEDGKEKEFYVLEQTTLNGFHYLLVEDGSADADDEEVEVLIMKRVADAAEDVEFESNRKSISKDNTSRRIRADRYEYYCV